jgi:hypothetical protein
LLVVLIRNSTPNKIKFNSSVPHFDIDDVVLLQIFPETFCWVRCKCSLTLFCRSLFVLSFFLFSLLVFFYSLFFVFYINMYC